MLASLCSTACHTSTKLLPEVAHGGKIVGRSVMAASASCEAGRAGVSLWASSGELRLSFKISVARTCELAAFSAARS